MPKLTRNHFAAVFEVMWARARTNFARDRHLAPVILGFDAMSRQRQILQVTEPVTEPGLVAPSTDIVVGQWRDNQQQLADIFARHRIVAAIILGEAFMATGDLARETVRMGITPGQHPMADDVAFAVGVYPREHFTSGHFATITRDDQGHAHPTLTPGENFDGSATLVSWLPGLLPQPH